MAGIDALSLDFATRHPDSFTRILAQEDAEECARVIDSLPAERRASIAGRLPAKQLAQLLASARLRPADWLADAPLGDAVHLLCRIPREQRLELVDSLENDRRRRELQRIQQYPAHSVGAHTGDLALCLDEAAPAAGVFEELRRSESQEPVPAVIVDGEGHYRGVLHWWSLLGRSHPSGPVANYSAAVRPVRPETPMPALAADAQWHIRDWLPVVDHRQRVLGIVWRETVFQFAASHGDAAQREGDIIFDLVADFVDLCDLMLRTALGGKRRT